MCIKYLIKVLLFHYSFVKKKELKLLFIFISYQIDLNIILSQKLYLFLLSSFLLLKKIFTIANVININIMLYILDHICSLYIQIDIFINISLYMQILVLLLIFKLKDVKVIHQHSIYIRI